jgi:GntR family transcriptional regulator
MERERQMDRISRYSKLPLYHQVYEIVRGNILNGHWAPGDMLPPESELVDRYEVSRTVVRQALDMLVNEGLIYRQRGRGTFVAHPTVEQNLLRIISFTDDMRQRGCVPETEVLFAGLVPAPEDIAAKLEVEPGEELARLDRLRLADGEPMSIEQSYLVHRYCPGVLDGDYAATPLREALQQRYDIDWTRASQVIRAASVTPEMARLLSVRPRSALLHIERVSYWQGNIPVEFLHVYYRGDRYSLYCELQG